MPDGSVLGDPANLALTNAIIKFGWPPEPRPAYDILPVVIELPGQEPKMYHWQPDEVPEVLIEHLTVPAFKEIGMRWYAIPAISNAYHHAADRWAVEGEIALENLTAVVDEDGNKRDRILILYASETGTAEGFARKAARQLQRFRPQVMALDEYMVETLAAEKLLDKFGGCAVSSTLSFYLLLIRVIVLKPFLREFVQLAVLLHLSNDFVEFWHEF